MGPPPPVQLSEALTRATAVAARAAAVTEAPEDAWKSFRAAEMAVRSGKARGLTANHVAGGGSGAGVVPNEGNKNDAEEDS